jgi:hypothetical protein
MNLLTIADALAARFASGVVTPPAGLKNITTATARPPNNIPNTPFVIAWPVRGDITIPPGQRKGEHEFSVVFYYAKAEADIPRQYVALMSWLGILLGQMDGQMQLGVVGVMKAEIMSWEIGVHVYAGDTYEGITLNVHVWTSETVTLVP